eukprot:COSAG01_NODE_5487_length_4230_cov_2.227548_1_plen_591_part_00
MEGEESDDSDATVHMDPCESETSMRQADACFVLQESAAAAIYNAASSVSQPLPPPPLAGGLAAAATAAARAANDQGGLLTGADDYAGPDIPAWLAEAHAAAPELAAQVLKLRSDYGLLPPGPLGDRDGDADRLHPYDTAVGGGEPAAAAGTSRLLVQPSRATSAAAAATIQAVTSSPGLVCAAPTLEEKVNEEWQEEDEKGGGKGHAFGSADSVSRKKPAGGAPDPGLDRAAAAAAADVLCHRQPSAPPPAPDGADKQAPSPRRRRAPRYQGSSSSWTASSPAMTAATTAAAEATHPAAINTSAAASHNHATITTGCDLGGAGDDACSGAEIDDTASTSAKDSQSPQPLRRFFSEGGSSAGPPPPRRQPVALETLRTQPAPMVASQDSAFSMVLSTDSAYSGQFLDADTSPRQQRSSSRRTPRLFKRTVSDTHLEISRSNSGSNGSAAAEGPHQQQMQPSAATAVDLQQQQQEDGGGQTGGPRQPQERSQTMRSLENFALEFDTRWSWRRDVVRQSESTKPNVTAPGREWEGDWLDFDDVANKILNKAYEQFLHNASRGRKVSLGECEVDLLIVNRLLTVNLGVRCPDRR